MSNQLVYHGWVYYLRKAWIPNAFLLLLKIGIVLSISSCGSITPVHRDGNFSCESRTFFQRDDNKITVSQPASYYFMEKMRQKYLDCYLHDINNALLANLDDITEITHLANLYKEKDIVNSFFHLSKEYYETLQKNDREFWECVIDKFISKDEIDINNKLICYFEYWETNIDGYKYISMEGFGECIDGYVVVSQIIDGEFLEENSLGNCSKINDYPEIKHTYIDSKYNIKQDNIKVCFISNAFLLFVIDRIRQFDKEIMTGLDYISSYKNKSSGIESWVIEYYKQSVIDHQKDVYNFWGIPNRIIDSVSQSDMLYLFNSYLFANDVFETKWGIIWYNHGSEKSFILGSLGFTACEFDVDGCQ